MITIPITYTGLTPSLTEDVEIVSGQRETLAVTFTFSEDWGAYTLRTAMFSSRTATRAQMIEEDGTAVIPSEVIRNGERYVKISAFGTLERADGTIERYNGRAITLRIDIGGDVEESGGCTDATAYEKLLVRVTALEERVDNLPAGGGGGGGSSVALDTTLTKKGYAADAKAVGDAIAKQNDAIAKKLDAEKLPAAVETALAEAKKSGEFDGQPGQPGTTPHIGANGNWWIGTTDTGVKAQGDDYVLTDSDKTAIAEEAAGMVDVPEKLPNPNVLTFTGAVTGTYDGSAPLNVFIPSGGGGTGGASVELDSTLTQQGKAADAKAVGDAIARQNDVIAGQNDAIEKKLDAEELPAAVETALAEAKESGEFDGDPGTTPHIGANGNWWIGTTDTGVKAQGGDYVLTDSDKTEIAEEAAGKINISGKADKTTVPNSAIVNADNELVMQRTDDDAVAELFKVALPAGGGGSEWVLIRDETLAEDVNEFTVSGIDYADIVAIIYPFKMNNATGDGATDKKLNPYVKYNGKKAQIMNLSINSTRNYVIVSQKIGSTRLTQAYAVPTNAYYETGAPAFHIRSDDIFWAGRINNFSISLIADWYIKAGVRIAIFGRG